jgi:hypothetical protein
LSADLSHDQPSAPAPGLERAERVALQA